MGKKDPGAWLLEVSVAVPELSVADISSQVTDLPDWPLGTVTIMSSRRPVTSERDPNWMTGGKVSTV